MKQLKTFKELVNGHIKKYGENSFYYERIPRCKDRMLIFPRMVKQEVIEWIKELGSRLDENGYGCYYVEGSLNLLNDEHHSDIDGVVKWAMHTFNITDENLK